MNAFKRLKQMVKQALRPLMHPWSLPATMVRGLNELGVKQSGLLLVHTSLAHLGYVPGGAAAVIRVLQRGIGPEGTLIIPTHTWEWMNAGCRVFDATVTQSCVGKLPDVFRRMPGVLRSLHPTHSVAAKGPRAAALIAGHETAATPCGDGTPYAWLLDEGGQILLLGCGTESNTCFHTLEARFGFQYLLREEMTRFEIIDADGHSRYITVPLHRDVPVRGEPIARRFQEMEDILVEMGIAKRGMIGQAHAVLIDGRMMLEKIGPLMTATPFYLLADPTMRAGRQAS
jgi:aminoglycoside 3-N-acetyltransferase